LDKSRRQFIKSLGTGTLGLAALSVMGPTQAGDQSFEDFMKFSYLMTEETELSLDFGKLCWTYVQAHITPAHLTAMNHFLSHAEKRESLLKTDPDLQSIAHHTLSVWYKGDLTSINPTPEQIKTATLHALKWRALGRPARGICIADWSKNCTTS
jgi:hypothetical protein